MQNTIKNSLLAVLVLCFVTSIANSPATAAVPMSKSKTTVSNEPPVGGAYLIFAGKTGGQIGKRDMEGQTKLGLNGCPGAKESTIVSFTLEIKKGGKATTLQSSSDKLTSDMVAKLKTLAAGDSFEFKKVMAHLPNSKDLFEVHTQKFTVG